MKILMIMTFMMAILNIAVAFLGTFSLMNFGLGIILLILGVWEYTEYRKINKKIGYNSWDGFINGRKDD